MSGYGIPPRFLNREWKGSLLLPPTGICLTGKTGVGKTAAICILVRDWLMDRANLSMAGADWGPVSRKSWAFISFPEFVMRLQDSFRDKRGDETALDLLESMAQKKFLIIDDLGAEKPTEYVRQATYYLINHREMYELPTFITTNFSMDHLDENIDPRISSRIAGMCDIIRVEGKDRRLER